ncbi:MAG: autotransporter-associated beta strand repeat-containing protein [Verrucomicrobiota bacterium]
MKKVLTQLRNLFTVAIFAAVFTAAFVPAASAGVTTISFAIQQGNVTTNGVLYDATYNGVIDGAIFDGNPTAALTTTTATNVLGNTFQTTPSGNNGRQTVGLFSYDLTQLNNFIAANNLSSNAVTIQSVSFQLISAGGNTGGSMSLGLYGTEPFTSSATWSNLDGTTPWSNPYQYLAAPANSQQYGYTGGGSALTPGLGGTSPNTTVTAGNPLTWTTSPAFLGAVQNALARADKKLYLTARGTFFNNGDNRLNVNFSSVGTAAYRPLLTVTLQINTSPSIWTGASDNSWITSGNWPFGGVPAADAQIIFNSSSTASLSTLLNQNFSTTNLIVTSPSGAVSIGAGGSFSLTLDGGSAIDLSGATTNLTITAPVILGAGQAWNIAGPQTLSVNGGISGAFALTNNGPGTLVLGGNDANTNLTVKGGTVSFASDGNTIGNPNPLGTYPASATAAAVVLSGNGASLLATASTTIDTNRGITLVSPGGALDASSGQTLTVNSVIAGSGALSKGTNGGTVILNTVNTMTGSTAVNGGTLKISSTGKLYGGTANTYSITVNSGGTLSVYNWAYGGSIGNSFLGSVLSGGVNPTINGGTITYTGTGAGGGEGTGQANSARIFSIGTAGATLDAEGTGTWYLTANASYDTNSSGVWIGQNIPIGTTLTLAGSSNGRYEKVLSGLGALAKSGAGTWTLAGSTNTYSGGTTINGGSLVPNNTNAIGTGPLTVNSGGVFYPIAASMIFTNPVTLNGSTLRVGGGASHQITYSGSFTTTTTAPNTTNSIICDGGTGYSVNSDNPGGGDWGAAQFINGNLDMGSNNNTLICSGGDHGGITINGSISGTNGTIINTAAELWLANASNSFSGTLRAGVKYVILGYSGANSLYNATLDMNAADSGSFYFQNYPLTIGGLMGSRNLGISGALSIGRGNASTTYSGALTNTGSITKIGTGTLTLSGVNTYSGGTTVSNGILQVNGSIASAATVEPGATLGGSGAISNSLNLVSGAVVTNNQGSPLTVTGALVANGNTMNVSTPSPLGVGDYTLMTYNTSGSSGSFNSTPIIGGSGLASGKVGTIVTASGLVTLHVASTIATYSTNITSQVSGNTLTLNWPSTHLGWYAQSNSVDLASPASWHDVPGSQSGTSLNITMDPAQPQVFYRLSESSNP